MLYLSRCVQQETLMFFFLNFSQKALKESAVVKDIIILFWFDVNHKALTKGPGF